MSFFSPSELDYGSRKTLLMTLIQTDFLKSALRNIFHTFFHPLSSIIFSSLTCWNWTAAKRTVPSRRPFVHSPHLYIWHSHTGYEQEVTNGNAFASLTMWEQHLDVRKLNICFVVSFFAVFKSSLSDFWCVFRPSPALSQAGGFEIDCISHVIYFSTKQHSS